MFATSTARMAARFLKTSSFSATTFFSAATLAISCLPCSSVSREKNRSAALGTTQRFQRKRYRATLLYKSAQAYTKTPQHFPLLTHASLQSCLGWTEIPPQQVGCGPDRPWKLRPRCRHLAPSTSRHHDASIDAKLDVRIDVVNDVHDWRHLRDRGCANHRRSVTSTKAPFPCVLAPRRPRPGTLVNGRVSARSLFLQLYCPGHHSSSPLTTVASWKRLSLRTVAMSITIRGCFSRAEHGDFCFSRFLGIIASLREHSVGRSRKHFVDVWVPTPAHDCSVLSSMMLGVRTACPFRGCR